MNRFRTKKKAKDAEGAGRASNDSEAPATGLKSSMTFRRGKRNNQGSDQKPELDVANALPSTDEFRTSLLMSGLSARFSMLREQDDPKSKLGKASDDSVLFPKRHSRLNDFGFQPNGLHDIAEVSSIKASIRPPFLFSDRVGSYHSTDGGYGTDDGGSIMSRAKPGEGNNLFGGRQKIYKIPVGGSSAKGSNMGGRALYEDDVSQSAFQKLREREREQREHELEKQQSQPEDDDAEQPFSPNRSTSPPLSVYNRNRETSSTTSSGPSLTRSSTAATSVTSQGTPSVNGHSSPSTPSIPNQPGTQGLDRQGTKSKRLYETGLDLHLHSQQYSAINRIDNLSRQQAAGTRSPSPTLVSPASAVDDSNHTVISSNQHPALRSASPPLSSATLRKFDFGAKSSNNADSQKPLYMSPPLSPPMSEGDDQTILPIQPNDRGKATALGAFTKPAQPYDEKKYKQRQLQMMEGRENSPLRKQSPPRAFIPGQQSVLRARAESSSTYSSGRSRSSSSAQREYLPHRNFAPQASTDETPESEYQIKSGTFLSSPNGNTNGSTMNSPRDNGLDDGKSRSQPSTRQLTNGHFPTGYLNTERPPESEHPANRQRSPRLFVDYTADADEATHTPEIAGGVEKPPMETKKSAADSPTLGPATGLSGMVRQHLRTDSNSSSVYGAPPPGDTSRSPENPPEENTYTNGNHWEFNNWDLSQRRQQNGATHVQTNGSGHVNRPIVPSPENSEYLTNATHKPWGKDGAPNHSRDISLETRKERDEFANELATRRMRVQANLRGRVESDSRSASPAPGADWSRDAYSARNSPMGPQKFKTGRGSTMTRPADGQSKAMKMLGIGQATINSSSLNSQNSSEDLWKREEEELLRGVKLPNTSLQTRQFRQARRDAQRDRERQIFARHQQRGIQDFGDRDRQPYSPLDSPQQQRPDRLYDRRAPSRESKDSAASNQSGSAPSRNGRDRSSSDTSARSKSRNGRYRDDLAKAMAEGNGSSTQGAYQDFSSRAAGRFPAVNGAGSPHPLNAPSPATARAGRSRSSSKSPPSRPFDNHQLQPIQTNHLIDIGTSPRPSPVTPYSINSTPALAQPSPVGPGIITPTTQGFQNHGRIPAGRKRSVNKSDISEPTLVSKTSQITTVDLPQGASLQNGMQASAPPLPQMHPRRHQTRTQTLYGVLTGKGNDPTPAQSVSSQVYSEDLSTFSADEADEKKPRQKLRKISSEGGNLNSKARQVFASAPSPALPGTISRVDISTSAREGTMF